jgi:hypothetical protein
MTEQIDEELAGRFPCSRASGKLHSRPSCDTFFASLFLALILSVVRGDEPPKLGTLDVTLKVGAEPRQKLLGFGCSLVDLGKAKIPEKERAEMFDRVIRDLGMTVVRLWIPSGADRTVEQMKVEFYSRYVDSGAVADLQQRGVTTLLLAPARGEKPPAEPMTEYARKLAIFIDEVRKERGVKLSVTGIANEPAGFTPEQLAEAVRVLRAELDARGLADVGIVAPEWASADGTALKAIAGLQADPAAWAALRGIATHSYNMAATPKFPAVIAGANKEYWQTEAGDTGNEGPADANRAASLSARFLNDLNHGVTHWIQFIGLSESHDVTRDRDNATKFMVYDHKSARIFSHLKYDWFRQLRAAFPTGAEVYSVQATPGGDLLFSYGQKPLLNAAASAPAGWALVARRCQSLRRHARHEDREMAPCHGPRGDLGCPVFGCGWRGGV